MGNSQWYKQTLRKTLVISLWWKIYIIYADIPCKQGDFYQFHLFSTVSRTGGKNWLLPGLAMSMSETSSREYPSSLPGGVVSKFWGRNANTCHWLMILVHSYSPLYNSNKLVNRHIYIIHNIICIRIYIYIYMYNICIYNIYIYISSLNDNFQRHPGTSARRLLPKDHENLAPSRSRTLGSLALNKRVQWSNVLSITTTKNIMSSEILDFLIGTFKKMSEILDFVIGTFKKMQMWGF